MSVLDMFLACDRVYAERFIFYRPSVGLFVCHTGGSVKNV